jgi:isocitrate dehydrogenase
MDKIKMQTPLVEMDGDEMARVLWKLVKQELIAPFIDLKTEYYDLGLKNRDLTGDEVTYDAAKAVRKYGIGVKCATITPNRARAQEYDLKDMYPSPNATIRSELDGTVFRSPIVTGCIQPYVRTWTSPITIARHAYGDVYNASELAVKEPGKAELSFIDNGGTRTSKKIFDFAGPGILQGQYNTVESIKNFAGCCFNYALDTGQDLWFSAKDTVSKVYDRTFKDIFEMLYENKYKALFEKTGIKYLYTLIDDAVSRIIRSKGGFILACKGYDGDVMSDMVATAFGAPAMMTSVLISPDGNYEFETAHGTVQKHYRKYLNKEETSTNPIATIFAWTGALRKRGEMDGNEELVTWADKMEKAVIDTVEDGYLTKDLARSTVSDSPAVLGTEDFISVVRRTFESEGSTIRSKGAKTLTLYEEFFDCRSYKRKKEILRQMGGTLTDKMLTDFAVSLDVVVNDGPFDARYLSLMRCLDQMARFETEGLR